MLGGELSEVGRIEDEGCEEGGGKWIDDEEMKETTEGGEVVGG